MKRIIGLIKNQKTTLRRVSMPFVMLLMSTAAHASCSKLAKFAGMSEDTMAEIIGKLVKVETTTGNYTTKNDNSGAYGRYQIMPSTAKFYAEKLGIPKYLWKKPYNQDKIFKAIMRDNIKSLKRNGHRISAFSLYATHQQGAGGFNAIMKNKKLTKGLEKNLRQNLPSHLRRVKKSRLRVTWIHYWKNKLG